MKPEVAAQLLLAAIEIATKAAAMVKEIEVAHPEARAHVGAHGEAALVRLEAAAKL